MSGIHERGSTRTIIENLRKGLVGSIQLTASSAAIDLLIGRTLKSIHDGSYPHTLIKGGCGQGKSHLLGYFRQAVINKGYAASTISLNLSDTSLSSFDQIYRQLMLHLELPGSPSHLIDAWIKWSRQQASGKGSIRDLLPAQLPDPYKCVLIGLVQKSFYLEDNAQLLQRTLLGEKIPLADLEKILETQQVDMSFARSLRMKTADDYVSLFFGLAGLLRKMTYKGLFLFIDNAQAMTNQSPAALGKALENLYQLLSLHFELCPLFVVLAVTDEFLNCIKNNIYYKHVIGKTFHLLGRNYATLLPKLDIQCVPALDEKEWQIIHSQILEWYTEVYRVHFETDQIDRVLSSCRKFPSIDLRARIRNLIARLDQLHQNDFLSGS